MEQYWNDFLTDVQVKMHVAERTSESLPVLAHEIDLDSIFYNLINNSVEALLKPSGQAVREISVQAEIEDSRWVVVEYSDNGPGLGSAFKASEDIFLFGETSKKSNDLGEPGGTGIGMWLLKNVVDDYGGRVDLRSKLGESGFKISISLPVHRVTKGGGNE